MEANPARDGLKQSGSPTWLSVAAGWHGVGWNYLVVGAVHALGLVLNHYYTITLKKCLGREGFKACMENRWVHGAAVLLTFGYCAATFLFFVNTVSQIAKIFRVLR